MANGSTSVDLLLICGEKHWHVPKGIVAGVAPDFYSMLSEQADQKDVVYFGKEHNKFNVDQVLRYVYTLGQYLSPTHQDTLLTLY